MVSLLIALKHTLNTIPIQYFPSLNYPFSKRNYLHLFRYNIQYNKEEEID